MRRQIPQWRSSERAWLYAEVVEFPLAFIWERWATPGLVFEVFGFCVGSLSPFAWRDVTTARYLESCMHACMMYTWSRGLVDSTGSAVLLISAYRLGRLVNVARSRPRYHVEHSSMYTMTSKLRPVDGDTAQSRPWLHPSVLGCIRSLPSLIMRCLRISFKHTAPVLTLSSLYLDGRVVSTCSSHSDPCSCPHPPPLPMVVA